MEVRFYDNIKKETAVIYSVIVAIMDDNILMCRKKGAKTWEIPGGKIEKNETELAAAKRELFEETGAVNFEIMPFSYYSVTINGVERFGKLFIAIINKLGELPEMEMEEVRSFEELPNELSYPIIQPILVKKALSVQGRNVLK